MANDPVTNPGGDGEVVNVTEVRAGFQDKPMLWVLGGGVILVFIALFGAWALFSGALSTTDSSNARQATDAQAFDTTLSPPRSNDIGQPSPDTGEPANTGVGTGAEDPRSTQPATGRGLDEGNPDREPAAG